MAVDPITLQSTTPATAPAGTKVAADDLGANGVAQYIKLMDGSDGSSLVIPGTTSNGLLVDVSRVIGTVTVDSELTAASALGDSLSATPSVVQVGAYGLMYNPGGPAYMRMRGDGSGQYVQGVDAEDAVVTAKPLIVGGVASNVSPTPVSADGDSSGLWVDRRGAVNVIARSQTAGANAVVPGMSTTAYSSGDQMGTLITVSAISTANYSATITGIVLTDLDKQLQPLELWLFQAAPTYGGGDNLAWDGSDTNLGLAKPIGVVDFLAANYRASVSAAICVGTCNGGVPYLPYISPSGNLYAYMVSRGTGTYAVGNLSVQIFVTLD